MARAQLAERRSRHCTAPESNDLLRAAPFDRITLIDGTVLIVDPVSPRPLPPLRPAKDAKSSGGATRGRRSPRREHHRRQADQDRDAGKTEKDPDPNGVADDEVKLHLLQGGANEVRDFKVKRASIKKIEYFEDMLLEECDRLVTAHDYSRAFECCLRVKTRNPGWAGLADRVNHVLFAEGSKACSTATASAGSGCCASCWRESAITRGCSIRSPEPTASGSSAHFKLGLYARGRRVLRELEELAPEHALVKADAGSCSSRGRAERVKEAEVATRPGAARRPGRGAAHLADAGRRRAALHEGVRGRSDARGGGDRRRFAARALGPHRRPMPGSAGCSIARSWPADDDDARKGKAPDQLAAAIESSDLGRRLLIRVRPGFLWSDGSRPGLGHRRRRAT